MVVVPGVARAVVVVIDSEEGRKPSDKLDALDQVASRGVSGFLVLHDGPSGPADDIAVQILSGPHTCSWNDGAWLRASHHGPTRGLVGTQVAVVGPADLLVTSRRNTIERLTTARVEVANGSAELLANKVLDVLGLGADNPPWTCELVVVLSGSYSEADGIVRLLTPFEEDIYVIAVGHEIREFREAQSQPQSLLLPYPPQSWSLDQGETVPDASGARRRLCSWYHRGTTRLDNCSRFDEEDATKSSGNLSILVDHFLMEVGFKLGLTKKYGA